MRDIENVFRILCLRGNNKPDMIFWRSGGIETCEGVNGLWKKKRQVRSRKIQTDETSRNEQEKELRHEFEIDHNHDQEKVRGA